MGEPDGTHWETARPGYRNAFHIRDSKNPIQASLVREFLNAPGTARFPSVIWGSEYAWSTEFQVDKTENDKRDILFGIKHKVNFIALSFVRNSETIKEVKDLLGKHAEHTEIIAKVENNEGVERLEEIVKEADGVMVARGDLGIEVELEEVPQIQRRIAFLCAKYGKRSIVATHMLESMIEHPVPTRAEVTDVANAVFEESDAIMLSGETSIGNYPVRSVETLKRIAKRTEIFPGVNFSKNLIMEKDGQHIAASALGSCCTFQLLI